MPCIDFVINFNEIYSDVPIISELLHIEQDISDNEI